MTCLPCVFCCAVTYHSGSKTEPGAGKQSDSAHGSVFSSASDDVDSNAPSAEWSRKADTRKHPSVTQHHGEPTMFIQELLTVAQYPYVLK